MASPSAGTPDVFGAVSSGIPSFGDLSWKAPVRVVAAVTLGPAGYANGALTRIGNGALGAIDGVSLSVGDRVLVAKQGTTFANGIYVVVSLGSAGTPWQLRRSSDCDSAAEMVKGAACLILEGAIWANVQAVAGASWTPTSGDPDWQPSPQLHYERQVFTGSGTWTRTNPLATVVVTAVGGGGGGGGTAATGAGQQAAGGGGGGGGAAVSTLSASSLAATEAVVVGNGGAVTLGASGGNAGSSSFALGKAYEVVGAGGAGGTVGNASSGNSRAGGGRGNIGINGDTNITGDDGGNAGVIGGQRLPFGDGGGSYMAGSARPPLTGTGTLGGDYGGGGSGASADASTGAQSGGPGAQGIVIVESYWIGRGSWT